MRIGIISAMKEEIQALLDELELESTHLIGKRQYYKGQLFGHPVVLVFSRWGKVAAATTVTQLINDQQIDQIIFTGVAGSMQSNIHIGDLVISRKLYQHDMDASPILPRLEIPLLKRKYFYADSEISKSLQKASQKFTNHLNDSISRTELMEFKITDPKVHYGDIASGDQFVSDKLQAEKIKTSIPEVACVEMEGAAVAQVCYEYEIPFSIIRTISDESNNNAHIDFPKFAQRIASKYAHGVLREYFLSL